MSVHQLTFEDIEKQRLIEQEPTRYAFVDEYGGFGFDFSKENTSKYFILCAVITRAANLGKLSDAVSSIRSKFFSGNEMKSSGIGKNDKRRTVVLTEIIQLDFKCIILVADKEEFKKIGINRL